MNEKQRFSERPLNHRVRILLIANTLSILKRECTDYVFDEFTFINNINFYGSKNH